jgi:ketosteroid isomerase-like protein
MATESFKTLEAGFEAWNRGDIDAVMESFSDDVVWRTGAQMPDIDLVYEGRDGVRRFFKEFTDPWDEISIEIEDLIDEQEDQIFVLVRFEARGREGIEVEGRFFQIYRYDEQHLCREFRAFAEEDEAEARREAGLIDG